MFSHKFSLEELDYRNNSLQYGNICDKIPKLSHH